MPLCCIRYHNTWVKWSWKNSMFQRILVTLLLQMLEQDTSGCIDCYYKQKDWSMWNVSCTFCQLKWTCSNKLPSVFVVMIQNHPINYGDLIWLIGKFLSSQQKITIHTCIIKGTYTWVQDSYCWEWLTLQWNEKANPPTLWSKSFFLHLNYWN